MIILKYETKNCAGTSSIIIKFDINHIQFFQKVDFSQNHKIFSI